MKTYVEEYPGSIIAEVKSGTLICENSLKNLMVIGDWISAQENTEVSIRAFEKSLFVDFPAHLPTSCVLSLLEHFEYREQIVNQKI